MHYLKLIFKREDHYKGGKSKMGFICAHISMVSASYLTEE